MSQSQTLFRLQQLDSQIDKSISRSSDIQHVLARNDALELAKVKQIESLKQLENEAVLLRKAEQAVQDQYIKIEQTEAALYSGKIRLPKELQDLQNEAAALKKYLVVLEDRQLEHMEAVETAQENLKQAQTALDQTLASWAEQTAQLSMELSQLQTTLNRLDAERKAALSPITSESLAMYETLRKQRNGVAVVIVSGKSCSACGTTLAPAILQSAQSSPNITRCPSCSRILYSG